MIVDTSAIVAILTAEDDAAVYAHAIADTDVRRLSAATYLECGIALDIPRDPVVSRSLDELLAEATFIIQPVTERHARLARQAYADFGKGSGHRAGLNFGDCFSYALALDTREPLLWKGDDFGRTGIASAVDAATRRVDNATLVATLPDLGVSTAAIVEDVQADRR